MLRELALSFCSAMWMIVSAWHGAAGAALLCGTPSFGFTIYCADTTVVITLVTVQLFRQADCKFQLVL